MHIRAEVFRFGVVAFMLGQSVHAEDVQPVDTIKNPAVGAVSAGGFSGKSGSVGLADGMIKIGAPAGGLLLLNPRYSQWDDDETVAGLGLIYRNIYPGFGRLTLHTRGEYRDTASGESLSSFAAGLEQRAPWFTYRLRGYRSPHGARLISRTTEENVERLPGGIEKTTRQSFEQYEIPLSGWDTEFAARLPIPRILGQVRASLGWHYLTGPSMNSQDGWLTRLDYRPREWLSLEMISYFNGSFGDSDIFWGGRVIIPFGPGSTSEDQALWFEPVPSTPRRAIRKTPVRENVTLRDVSTRRLPGNTPQPVSTPSTPTPPTIPITEPDIIPDTEPDIDLEPPITEPPDDDFDSDDDMFIIF